jgi:hypothetical protein
LSTPRGEKEARPMPELHLPQALIALGHLLIAFAYVLQIKP